MPLTRVKVRKWGDSFGVVIPKELVDGIQIHSGDTLVLHIEKEPDLSSFFGKSRHRINPQKFKDEMRHIWGS